FVFRVQCATAIYTLSLHDALPILTVMLGLRMGHERHGFDYDDEVAVREQKESIRAQVLKYKDHPALLTWGLGNEVDLMYTNTNVDRKSTRLNSSHVKISYAVFCLK